MSEEPRAIPDTELEQLLRDAGRQLAYPPMPDFAAAFETPSVAVVREPLGAAGDAWRPPRYQVGSDPSPSIPAGRPRTRRTQALRLGGAVAAFAIVGLVLVLIFRSVGDDEQPSGGTTTTPTEPLLIAVSSEGPVTAIDPETGAVRYIVDGGYQPDAILSPDGTRLYVAGDDLSAHNARTGEEIWRVPYQFRQMWTVDQSAPSTLAIAPDGTRLYLASYDQERGTSPDAITIPHFVQTFDTANGENLGESEAIRGGCTVPLHPSQDGQLLHAPCDGSYSVYELQSGSLQPPPSGRVIISASAQHDDELLLVSSSGIVQVVDMSSVAIVRDATLQFDGQVSPGLLALSVDGSHLYVGVSTSSERFFADQVLVFDTETWQQTAHFTLEEPLLSRDLAIDREGAVYGASTSYVAGTSIPVSSTVWRMSPETGTVEAVARLAAQEVAHVLLGYVPVTEQPRVESTPTSDATSTATLPIPSYVPGTDMAAVGTALAEVPEDVRTCTALQTGPHDRPVRGRALAGTGDFSIMRMVGDEQAPRVPFVAGAPATVRIHAGAAPYPETAQPTIRATHVESMTVIETGPDNAPRMILDHEFNVQLWEVVLTFPQTGCWELLFITDQFVGVVWFDVFEALPLTATPGPTPTPPAPNAPTPTMPISTMRPEPTATIDMSDAAIEAALAALPEESKGCQVTPGVDGDTFGWEVHGVTLIGEGELWMSFVGNGADYLIPPLQAGRSTSVYWNIGGPDTENPAFVELTATELGAGTQIGPDGPQNAGESPFFEGVIWKSYFTFPHAGCWQMVAERAGYAGVLWLTVEDAP